MVMVNYYLKNKNTGFRKNVLPVSKKIFWAKNSESRLRDRLIIKLLIQSAFF